MESPYKQKESIVFLIWLWYTTNVEMHWLTYKQNNFNLLKAFLGIYADGAVSYNIITDVSKENGNSCVSLGTSRKYKLYGIPNCSQIKRVMLEGSMSTNYKSTCPWYVYLDYDEDRVPKTFAKAHCTCRNCISDSNNISANGLCEEVNSYSPVIRRKWCPGGHTEYSVTIETIPVGCTCKRNIKKNNTLRFDNSEINFPR